MADKKISAGTEKLTAEFRRWAQEVASSVQRDTETGAIVSPNGTKEIIDLSERSSWDFGHAPGFEKRHIEQYAEKVGLTQEEVSSIINNPGIVRPEPRFENRPHFFEVQDTNDAMQNISAYLSSQDSNIAEHTIIDPNTGQLFYAQDITVAVDPEKGNYLVLSGNVEEIATFEPVNGVKPSSFDFSDGASYLMSENKFNEHVLENESAFLGRDGQVFITPKSEMDKLLRDYPNDPRMWEKKLGNIDLGDGNVIRVDIANPEEYHITAPRKSSFGATDSFVDGGFTSGKMPEGVIHNVETPKNDPSATQFSVVYSPQKEEVEVEEEEEDEEVETKVEVEIEVEVEVEVEVEEEEEEEEEVEVEIEVEEEDILSQNSTTTTVQPVSGNSEDEEDILAQNNNPQPNHNSDNTLNQNYDNDNENDNDHGNDDHGIS